MEHFIKNSYDQGAAQALADFGIKTAGENDTVTKVLGAFPGYGPAFAALSGAAQSPDGRGVSRGIFGGAGSALGQVAGVVGGGLAGGLTGIPLAVIAHAASKGKIRPEHVLIGTGGTGAAAGMLYGGYKGTEAGLDESRRGDTLMEKLRQLPGE